MKPLGHAARCSFGRPTLGRFLVVGALLLAARTTAQAPARSPLTERDVVQRTLARAPLVETLEGDVAIEEGRGIAASAYPNPQVAYMREETFGGLGTGEDYLSIAQTVDLGNRRSLRGDAGEARARAVRREGDAARLLLAAEARLRFYEALVHQDRLATLEGWIERIDDALTIVTRREERGDASVYERRRLERERLIARGRLESERAALDGARAQLVALVGALDHPVELVGTLLPESDPADLPVLRASSAARPDLLALDLRLEAATLDARSAARWWIPDLRLEGGWKGVVTADGRRSDGFLLGASLSIPLWDRSTGLARVADGEALAARGRRALLDAELEGELEGVREQAKLLRRAAIEFRERSTSTSSDLVAIASAGYDGGEFGLLELLDAFRGFADDAWMAIDMDHAARRARIELDRMTGAQLP